MAEHHERAVARFVESARARGALGVLVVGSVARGSERDDSDVDVYEVVDDARFAAALADGTIASVDTSAADWPGGYVDSKLVSPALLRRAADEADDATRASLVGARVVLDETPDAVEPLADLIAAITAPGPAHFAARIHSFAAQFALHADYFLPHGRAHDDAALAANAAVHAGFAAGRIALAERAVLYRGPKYLLAQLREAGCEELAAAIVALVDGRSEEAVERVRSLVPVLSESAGVIDDDALARFITDNEWAWFTGHAPPEHR